MTYLFYLIFVAIGILVGALVLTQTLTALYFGLPFTKQLDERDVLIKDNPIKKHLKKTVFTFLSITIIVTILVAIFFQEYFMLYTFATLAPVVIMFKQFKTTDTNVIYYFSQYREYIVPKNIPVELKKYYEQAASTK